MKLIGYPVKGQVKILVNVAEVAVSLAAGVKFHLSKYWTSGTTRAVGLISQLCVSSLTELETHPISPGQPCPPLLF